MNITTVTCTGDRPEAFALCEKYLSNQRLQPYQMIVLDDGERPVKCNLGQDHFYNRGWRGKGSLIEKLRWCFSGNLIKGDAVAFWEDDDVYMPEYLDCMESRMRNRLIAGESWAIYYNVAGRWWFNHRNENHASLCQTVVAREAFKTVIKCLEDLNPFLDVRLWEALKKGSGIFKPSPRPSCIGIKSMPGRKGYGSGHEAKDKNGIADPYGIKLKELIGEYAEAYAGYYQEPK